MPSSARGRGRTQDRIRIPRAPLVVRLACALAGTVGLLAGAPAGAGGVDLADPTPRWIEVEFEVSPSDRPGQLHGQFTGPFSAWLEPGPRDGQVRITVPAEIVERHLMADENPVPGSFSDFVWIFDVATGHVLSARLSGVLVKPMEWGFVRTQATTRVHVEMSSRRPAGYDAVGRWLGHDVFRYCETPGEEHCVGVAGAALDPETGWVNAVGPIAARTGPFGVDAFSPIGEALFRERAAGARTAGSPAGPSAAPPSLSAVSAPPPRPPSSAASPALSFR